MADLFEEHLRVSFVAELDVLVHPVAPHVELPTMDGLARDGLRQPQGATDIDVVEPYQLSPVIVDFVYAAIKLQ